MEADVSVGDDEVSFDPQDLLGDPARQEISQTSLEIMQLLAECEGGHELFGNIHQGNFIYDNASLVGSSSELSDIFQDDSHTSVNSGHRLDDILVNSIESLNKSPTKSSNCQDDPAQQKKTRKSQNLNKKTPKSSKPKTRSSRRKDSSKIDSDGNSKRKPCLKLSKSAKSDNNDEQLSVEEVRNGSNLSDSTSCSRFEINSKYEIGTDGTYTCTLCGKKFSTVRFLQIHSTVHRQKVRLVRSSSTPSKKDSDLQRSKKSSSPSTMKNTSRNGKDARKGLMYSCVTKKPDIISDVNRVQKSAECDRHMTDRSRLSKCAVSSQEGDLSDRRKESASDTGSFHHSDISDLTDFIDKREGNSACSETLKSLSKHGAKEYLSLSAKKSKASRKNKTVDKLNSCGDTEVIANSATEKPPHRNVSKTQKKSVILTGQRSVSELKGKRKRKASGKYNGEKRPLKRVRLLDRFWDDDEQSSNSGSVYFSTVDLNPNTNGGLLQSFDVDQSKKSWRSGQTKVRIKQGQFIRTKTMEVYKSLEQKACESKQIVTGKKDRNFASTDNSSNVCVRSNSKKEFGQHGSNNTQILQNTHPNFSKHLDYDLTSNVKPSQTLCPTDQKCQPEKLSNNDETFNSIKKGAESDKSFHQNLEGKCQMNAEVTPKLSKETIQKTNMRGDNSIGENHIGSSSVQNNIPQTLISKCDNCKDSDSEDGEEAETIFSKNGGTRGQTFCNDEGLRRKSSNNGVNESSTNRQSSCEPIIYESERYYDYGGDNEGGLSNSDTSDDDSQPLVLYQQSCRTLPLCALLKLARCQKLEYDLSKKKDSERENNLKISGSPVLAKGTQLSDVQVDLHCDENIASEKIEEFALLPQDVDESPSKTQLMSDKDMDVSSEEIPEHHFNTNLLDRNAVGIENVTKYVQVDRQESVSGSDSPFLPAELPKFKCGSDSNSLSSAPAKSVSGSHSVSLPPEPAKSVSGSDFASLPTEPAYSVSVLEPAPAEPPKSVKSSRLWNSVHEEKAVLMSTDRVKSDLPFVKLEQTLCDVEQQGNSIKDQLKSNSVCDLLTQESDTNRSNLLPMTERPLYDGSSSSVIKCHEEDRVSKLIADSDFQKSPKLSKVTEDICSLKSIADDNCIEISRSVIQQCSLSVNSDHEASVKPAVQEMSGEDEGHRMLEKNKPHLTVESDDVLDDMVDECFDNNSVDDVTSDDSQIRNSVMSTYNDEENSVSLSTELKLGFRHIEVPQRLPKNLMSTCNFVGSFADDMVTGITNIIDTETHSSNSSSVFSKYHDYCARQISYQNFLEWKLQESVHKECSLDNDMCARSLAYQDFQRTKCQDLLSSEKYLGEMDLTTNFQDTDSQNSEMKMAPMDDTVDKGVITQTDKIVDLNTEQLAVRQADDTSAVTRNFEQPNVRKADDTVTKNWEPGMREADDTIGKKDREMNVRTVLNDETKDDVSVENCDRNDSQNSHASHQKDLNDIRKNPSFCVTNLVPTDLYQTEHILTSESSSNIEVQSKKQQTVLLDNEMNSVDMSGKAVLTVEGESSEDETDISINIDQVDTCARVLPFETNIMHKFSNKTKLLFQEYHNRQQTSQDISSDDTDEKYPEQNLTIDNHTQTVSSMEENECSMYEMHMLGNSNSNENQNILKMNTSREGTRSSFNEITSEEGSWSTESLKTTQTLTSVNSRGFDVSVSMASNFSESKSKSDSLPFKSSMNVFNLEDISNSVLNQQNVPLSEQEKQYLKSPKKLWYRNYMGGMSTMKETRGDNSETFEVSNDQKSFIIPEVCDSEKNDNTEVELSTALDSNTAVFGKENAPEKNLIADSEECSQPDEFRRQSCDVVVRNSEESQNSTINTLSDTDHFSDVSVRVDICSRMRQFRKRRSCARACRDGYLPGCARSRVFVRKTSNK